jgi:sRNA-binding carbon storage regulator CsrA
MSSSSIGKLIITRRFYQSFCLLLEPQVGQKLTAKDLFHVPVCIAILPGRSQKQMRLLIEADKRINILRGELKDRKNSQNKKTCQTLTDATLAEIFMNIARDKLPTKEFNYLQYLAQHQITQKPK